MDKFVNMMIIVNIILFVVGIIFLVRWWKMTSDVKKIRRQITQEDSPQLTYLVAIGEKEQAQKGALKMVVDMLYSIYIDAFDTNKADNMNRYIAYILPKIHRLGLTLPAYVTSGEQFIDYMNNLTGADVPYSGIPSKETGSRLQNIN